MSRLSGAGVLALAGVTAVGATAARAQPWNYGNGSQFFVPITLVESNNTKGGPLQLQVSLTLGGITSNDFTLDTGSLGLVADSAHYVPNTANGDVMVATNATITYSTSGANPQGPLWLTNVQINGAGGQSVTARVPVLASQAGYHQLGVGFNRGGITYETQANPTTPASGTWNMNPFLAVTNGPGGSALQPGYIIAVNDYAKLGLSGPGLLLGLNSTNTGGFAFQQLAANATPSYYGYGSNTPSGALGPLVAWSSQQGSITITAADSQGNQQQPPFPLGPMSLLPDSGISYMIVDAGPNNGIPIQQGGTCSDSTSPPPNCLYSGSLVQVFLPGQSTTTPAYSFIFGTSNGVNPYGVQITDGASLFSNLGRTFFQELNYLYDPVNGFVGYMGSSITSALALQGNLTLPDGFLSSLPTFLMADLTVQQTGSGALNGPIAGPGGMTLQSGNLTLGGAGSYTGGTNVNGGLLTIASTGSIVGNVTVNNGGGLTNNGAIGGNGMVTINAGGTFTNNGTVDTPLQWQVNQGTFANNGTFNGSLANTGTATNSSMLMGAVINGSAGVLSNTGTIAGNVSNMGRFANNGTVGGSFSNMGMLSGNGTVGGDLTNSGAVAPGNSIGTTNVSGNYTHAAAGAYVAEVNGQGQSDRIAVSGTATLQGGQVIASTLPGQPFAPTTRYTILNAVGGVSGSFSNVTSNSPFLLPSLSYDASNVYLTLQIGGFSNVAQTPQQQAIANALDSSAASATGDYATVLSALAGLTPGQVQSVLTSLSGTNYSGFSSAMVQGAQLFMSNFAGQAGGGGSTGSNRVALAEACDVACDSSGTPRWGAWGGAIGGLGTIGAGTPQGAVTYNAGGFAAGLDRAFADSFRAGVTVGYSAGTQWVSGFSGQGNTNTVQFGLYGNYADGPVYADALFGYAYSANQMTRQIVIPGLQPRTAWGQTGANQFFGQLEAGYRIDVGTRANGTVTPFARLQAYTGTQNGFTETGAQSLNLSVAQQTTSSLRSVIGAQLGAAIDLGWREKLALQFRLGWSHEYADVGRPVSAALAGAPAAPFTTFGLSPVRDGVLLGFGASTAVADATSLFLRYEGTIAGQDGSHALTAGIRMTW
jgi:uncharacterized protein with beta-barrel porin domain